MESKSAPETLRRLEIPGRVEIIPGRGGLWSVQIHTPWSDAELYLHGAQVTGFQKRGEPPLLFLSAKSEFAAGKAIRGGIPFCFPWFGARTGESSHGFARNTQWNLIKTSATPEGIVTLYLELPRESLKPAWSALRTEFIATFAETLTLELIATNESTDKTLELENCLHTYFHVRDIGAVTITGLAGAAYFDNAADGQGARKVDLAAALQIGKETNRIYTNTRSAVEICDTTLRRTIRIEKFNSHSTVVWNPWTTQLMADFDPAEHKNMVCVEAGNVKENQISLAPGKASALKMVLHSRPI